MNETLLKTLYKVKFRSFLNTKCIHCLKKRKYCSAAFSPCLEVILNDGFPLFFTLKTTGIFRHNLCLNYTRFQKSALLMLNISKIRRRFFCKFGMVSPKYTIHRSNIKPIPCWAELFALYGNT